MVEKETPFGIIILHIMHMAYIIILVMGFSFLPIVGNIRFVCDAHIIHLFFRFVNPFLQFFKKNPAFL